MDGAPWFAVPGCNTFDEHPRGDWIGGRAPAHAPCSRAALHRRSEEHTSELQSLAYLVCRLLLEKKNTPPPASSRWSQVAPSSSCAASRWFSSRPFRFPTPSRPSHSALWPRTLRWRCLSTAPALL